MTGRNARRFGLCVRIGVVANLCLAVPALLAPGPLLALMRLEPALPDVWVRFAAWLLILLSLSYLPAAADPLRAPSASRLVVGSRVAGVIFFTAGFLLLDLPATYLLFGAFDLLFAVPEGIFLRKALRESG